MYLLTLLLQFWTNVSFDTGDLSASVWDLSPLVWSYNGISMEILHLVGSCFYRTKI